jgi:hypothetical protein
LRNPDENGDRDAVALAEHLGHDLILHWAGTPGGGRAPAPYSLQAHVDDILAWGAAGMPCPQDEMAAFWSGAGAVARHEVGGMRCRFR